MKTTIMFFVLLFSVWSETSSELPKLKVAVVLDANSAPIAFNETLAMLNAHTTRENSNSLNERLQVTFQPIPLKESNSFTPMDVFNIFRNSSFGFAGVIITELNKRSAFISTFATQLRIPCIALYSAEDLHVNNVSIFEFCLPSVN